MSEPELSLQQSSGIGETIAFTCNICRAKNTAASRGFHREISNCSACGSTPRFRGIVRALSIGLFGSSMCLLDFPENKNIYGIGMSEHELYCNLLTTRLSFMNTFYHVAPRLDIRGGDWRNYEQVDFIICTEIFEHILQPVIAGMKNLQNLLKPSGFLIFSVPSTDRLHTQEHFPGMTDFGACQVAGKWVVVSKSENGRYELFHDNIHFHGGPGTVLEMRLFSHADVLALLAAAGFTTKVYDEPALDIGYYWPALEERPGAGRNQSFIIEARPNGLENTP